MYKRDVEAIIAICEQKQSVLPVVLFVLTTIQSALFGCKNQIKDTNKLGSSSRFMWGKKGDGLDYTRQNDAFLWGKINHIKQSMGTDSVEACVAAIELFLAVPNLGMVKAAFAAQCLGFNVACIDSHNLKRLGMNENQVKLGKVKPETRTKKITAYVEMTQEQGSEYWWDSWCEYVAGNQANRQLDTGDVVSRYHVECVDLVEVK
jgi:hypothetical protein